MEFKSKKGFVTVATGEKYVKLAVNLLKSYRLNTKEQLPFCLITDNNYDYNNLFDDVVILPSCRHNTLDKIEIAKYSPYEKNVFIEPDVLVYQDANIFFNIFENADAFSAIGKTYSLDENKGWFIKSTIGKYADKVSYSVGFHGGVYYVDNDQRDVLDNFYNSAWDVVANNDELKFWGRSSWDKNGVYGYFNMLPNDETVISLTMALNNCKTVKSKDGSSIDLDKYLLTYPSLLKRNGKYKCNISKGQLEYCFEDELLKNVCLFHFGNYFTNSFCYQREIYRLDRATYKTNSRSFLYIMTLFVYEKSRKVASFIKHKILKK